MARTHQELDLFSTAEKNAKWQPSATIKPPTPIFERRRSFRDIHDVTSQINPEILKSVIANNVSVDLPTTPKEKPRILTPLPAPVCDTKLGLSIGSKNKVETASMTIFYNGMVAAFDVSPHKAQDVFKLAQDGVLPTKLAEPSVPHSYDDKNLLTSLYGDLPLARKKSLQRFLEKRKERFTMVSPYYACSSTR